MNRLAFGQRVKQLLKEAGLTQKDLASKLEYNLSVLTHKLNGTGRTTLSREETRQIILGLVELGAATNQTEIQELIKLLGIKVFSPEEWQTSPLKWLQVEDTHTNHTSIPLHNLPHTLATFTGRQKELVELSSKIHSPTRLISLVGTAGIGKTRLALELARNQPGHFRDGVWLVELAQVFDPTLIGQVLVNILEIKEEPGRPVEEILLRYLKNKQLLIVLDNCEHLLAGCHQLVSLLLKGCSHLKILATSREPLRVEGEYISMVPALALPASGFATSAQPLEYLQYEAVSFFVDRAILANSGFSLNSTNCADVVQLCHRLDGVPLALELAAARVTGLSIRFMAERLDGWFNSVEGGRRGMPSRHQSLKALIDWSYNLLTGTEQQLFLWLSIFTGGWTYQSAWSICGMGLGLSQTEFTEAHFQLTNCCLVVTDLKEVGANKRYRMLEIIREYGLGKLREEGTLEKVTGYHLEYFKKLALESYSGVTGSQYHYWFEKLELEMDNLRAAMGVAAEATPDSQYLADGLRLAYGLEWYWNFCGYVNEGTYWLEKLLARGSIKHPGARAAALVTLLNMRMVAQHYRDLVPLSEEAVSLARESGEKLLEGFALGYLAYGEGNLKNYQRADQLFEEAISLLEEIDSKLELGCTFYLKAGYLLEKGEALEAERVATRVVDRFHNTKSKRLEAISLFMLGLVNWLKQDLDRAQEYFEVSMEILERYGRNWDTSWTNSGLAFVLLAKGQPKEAAENFITGLNRHQRTGAIAGLINCLEGLLALLAGQENWTEVARVGGMIEGMRRQKYWQGFLAIPFDISHYLKTSEERLGLNAFERLKRTGSYLELEEIYEYAARSFRQLAG